VRHFALIFDCNLRCFICNIGLQDCNEKASSGFQFFGVVRERQQEWKAFMQEWDGIGN